MRAKRALVLCALVALSMHVLLPAPPPRTLDGLAAMLSAATGGKVNPSDIGWEPSPGILTELVLGRRLLFLAKSGDGGRDLFRARVRVTMEGRPITVAGIHNLSATPLGDEQSLVVNGERVAFATAAYGKIESVTLLDLSGKPFQESASYVDVATSLVTNWQETGSLAGIGRVDVHFDTPLYDVRLALGPEVLSIESGSASQAVDVGSGALLGPGESSGVHAIAAPTLHKRPILWAVDTVRAEVGPEPVAMVEAAVFNARDIVRRSAYAVFGPEAHTQEAPPPPPPPPSPQSAPRTLDAVDAQNDASVWPPAPIAAIWKNPEPGEGTWEPVVYPWLKRLPTKSTASGGPPPYFYRTLVRPDPDRPYAKVLIVAMDMRQLELDMEAGVEDPKPLTGPHGSGKIPRDPMVLSRIVGAFNGAFKTTHGEYGMMVHRRVLLPPKPGAATLVVSDDKRIALGTWGPSAEIPPWVISYRQNLEPLVEDGRLLPSGRTQWGWQLSGTSMLTERSGTCVTASGQLYYLWGDE
ncbi:MAG TPA: hypothetical protein VJT73_16140, partial [Polyangiaceae bacterium]|nr:hypothetical protein [Polyangiaceae bacterium]